MLYAEDEADDVFLMRRAVSKLGLSVRLAVVRDGEEALRYLNGEGSYEDRARFPMPALILLDLKMPRKSGLEVLECLHDRPEFAALPAVMLTSSQVDRDIERARELGARAYLLKPVAPDDLRHLLTEPERFFAEEHWAQGLIRARW